MTCSQPTTPRPRTTDGFIVVAVLWILGALATLATIYSVYVIDTAVAFSVHDERLQANAMVTGALELTAYQVASPLQVRPPEHAFTIRMGRANVAAAYRSEGARIDLNAAPKELLAGLFTTLGARPADAANYADRIVGWRNPPLDGPDSEASAYRTAGLRYVPRGARFAHTGELSLVMGIPDFLVERALPFVTVYSGQAQVNVLEAAPEVLAALPGMNPDMLHSVLVQRAATPQNGQLVTAQLGPAQEFATAGDTKTVRVTVRVAFDNGRRLSSEVVILLSDDGPEPYHVLSWRDQLDELPDERARTGVR
jgi:general secretion pathway protein K